MNDASAQLETPENPALPFSGSVRRTVLDWRDYWLVESELVLNREVQTLFVDLENLFANVSFSEYLLGAGDATRSRIEQTLQLWTSEVQERLLDRAHAELRFALRSERLPPQDLIHLLRNCLILAEAPLQPRLRQAIGSKDWAEIRALVIGTTSDSILLEILAHLRALAAGILTRA